MNKEKVLLLLSILGLVFVFSCNQPSRNVDSVIPVAPKDNWALADSIEKLIVKPVFPDNKVSIVDFGAVPDSTTDCTEAIKMAIDSCYALGGGTVVVPEGTFLTGAVHLKSNINLHVSQGARLLFSQDYSKYLPVVKTRWEGNDCYNYSPLIYALDAENIGLTGGGVIDGNASNEVWWPWKGREKYGWAEGQPNQFAARDVLLKMSDDHVPVEERVFGEGHYLRPSFVEFYGCKNIIIDSVTVVRSPMWELHPTFSENITVSNIKIISHGPNNDGFDPESCKNILVENCFFDTGDDCIAIKSGREEDGRRDSIPSENIIIRNCTMKDGHGGVVIGSEISGGCRNVFVENCTMDSPHLDRAIRIKSNSLRGGLIENIFVRNVTVGEVKQAVLLVNFYYEQGDSGEFAPIVRNVCLDNVTSSKSKFAVYLKGYDRSPISNITVKNCDFKGVEKGNMLSAVKNVTFENVLINGQQYVPEKE